MKRKVSSNLRLLLHVYANIVVTKHYFGWREKMSANYTLDGATIPEKTLKSTALKVALIYASISVLWILFSDQILSIVVKDIDTMTRLQMVKGWFFVLATSYIIYILLRNDIKRYFRVYEALQHSQQNLLSLMEALPTAVSWADEKGNIQYSNHKFRELFGYTIEDAPTVEKWFQLAYPDQEYRQTVFERWEGAVQNAQDSGSEISPMEVTVTCRDGSTRYVAIMGALLHEKILGVFYNLTESKQAETALEESENRYRTLFESANDAILIMQDNQFIECNQKTLEVFGCTREQIVGQTPHKFSPPVQPDGRDSAQKAQEKITTVLNGQPDVFEWRHKRYNGEVFDAEISLSLIEIESQKYIQAIVRDISVRRQLDRKLQLMQRWIEQSVDLFFWVGDDSRILYVNEAVCYAFGYSLEEFCTMKVGDFDLELNDTAWPEFAKNLRQKKSLSFETRFKKKDGRVFPAEITANTLTFDGKNNYFAYARDISERVRYEKEQKKLETQLRQAQKMESLGTLAGGIAHDFNNILGAILGYAEMVKVDLPSGSPLVEMQQGVIKAGLRARDLVQQILLFSRQVDHEVKAVQPHLIVKEALKLLRSSIPVTIEIKQFVQSDCGSVLADPTQLHQIIMNLCTNAYYAMRASGGVLGVNLVKIEVTEDDISFSNMQFDPGCYVKLEISDTGHGMDSITLENIFTPYFTTKPKGEGTGLGLSVVLGIVKSFNGHIKFYSEPGKGTTANVYFPCLETETDAVAMSVEEKIPTGTERVLLVDDELEILEMAKLSLESLGYQVLACTSSQEALAAFAEDPEKFDLVVTDMTMPQLTGMELIQQLFAVRPHIPVILCTGFSELITKEKACALGIRELLTKPVLRTELAKSVRKALDN